MATLVNYSCKSFIKLTPGLCFCVLSLDKNLYSVVLSTQPYTCISGYLHVPKCSRALSNENADTPKVMNIIGSWAYFLMAC